MLITKRSLQVAKAASTGLVRPGLNAILVEPDGTVVATDGHILVTFKDEMACDPKEFPETDGINAVDEEPLKPVAISLEQLQLIEKSISTKTTIPALLGFAIDAKKTNEGDHIHVGVNRLGDSMAFKLRKIDGEYPNWRKVVDTKKANLRVGFGVDVLGKVLGTMKALGVKHFGFEFTGDASHPVRIWTKDGVRGVIMPCRIDWPEKDEWLEAIQKVKGSKEEKGNGETVSDGEEPPDRPDSAAVQSGGETAGEPADSSQGPVETGSEEEAGRVQGREGTGIA
jgi:hypothetical protein